MGTEPKKIKKKDYIAIKAGDLEKILDERLEKGENEKKEKEKTKLKVLWNDEECEFVCYKKKPTRGAYYYHCKGVVSDISISIRFTLSSHSKSAFVKNTTFYILTTGLSDSESVSLFALEKDFYNGYKKSVVLIDVT